MRFRSLLLLSGLISPIAAHVFAQDLAPRAYIVSPLHANAVTLTWAFYDGGVDLNGTVAITGATGRYNVPVFSYYHSLNFFGRFANFTVSLPYAVGNFQGDVLGAQKSAYRSGLLDLNMRFAVNLKGGPAMEPFEFSKWKQRTLLGVSVKVIAPTGQYNPAKLVNWGINRWAFKPEFGCSQRWSNWVIDGYAGAWLYTQNPASFDLPVPKPQTEGPIGSLEGHLSYDFGHRTWVSLDGNFWWGGVTSLGGVSDPSTKQVSSRLGGTASIRLSKHQSIKASYSHGTYIRFGGDYHNVSVAWQFSWLGRPK